MKLNKQEIERLTIGVIGFAALIYAYTSFLLGPVSASEKKARNTIAETEPKIAEAKAQIDKTQALEAKAPGAQKTLDQIKALIPDGAPVAWFPPRVQEFFRRMGIEKATTRLSNEFNEKDLQGFRRIFWSIDIPQVGSLGLGRAIAEWENNEPLLEITNIQLESIHDNPEFCHAVLTVATILKQ